MEHVNQYRRILVALTKIRESIYMRCGSWLELFSLKIKLRSETNQLKASEAL